MPGSKRQKLDRKGASSAKATGKKKPAAEEPKRKRKPRKKARR